MAKLHRNNNQAESVRVSLKPEVMKALAHLAVDRRLSKGELATQLIEQALKATKY